MSQLLQLAAAPGTVPIPCDGDQARVHAALLLLLASDGFCKARRMCKLLRFLVDKRVAGAVRATSEYAIGIDVFERDPATYNTCDDPIVRVQVGRLREKLRLYYAAAGKQAGVRFSIPVGSYMPEIEFMRTVPPGIGSSYLLAIAPLVFLAPDAAGAAFARGLNEELAYHLFKAFGQTIVSHTAGADAPGVSHRLEGSVRVHDELMRTSIRLIDSSAGCIVWSQQFDYRAPLALPLQEQLAGDICAALAQYFALG